MDTQIILIYCLCDDLLKAMHHHEDEQCRMSDAEVMTRECKIACVTGLPPMK